MADLKEHNISDTDKNPFKYNFTVVLTSYNKGKYLKQAIDSVRGQTLQDVQLIVVDDCSDDPRTIRVLDKISGEVHLIRSDKNKGVSSARNEGIRNSDSEYICCLDGDDYLEPTYLEKAKEVFKNNKDVGIVTPFVKQLGYLTSTCKVNESDVSLIKMLDRNAIKSASCFRRESSIKVGMYDEGLESHEDWEHWINIIKNGWKVEIIPQYLLNYRIHQGSKYRNKSSKADIYYSYIINKHRGIYEKHWTEILAAKHLQTSMVNIKLNRFKSFLFFRIAYWIFNTSERFLPKGLSELIFKRLLRY